VRASGLLPDKWPRI